MTANDHNRLLGIFYTVIGGIIALCALGLIAMPFLFGPTHGVSDEVYRNNILFFVIFGTIVMVLGLLALSVGVGVLQQRGWARIGSIVTGILFLVNFPIGMALGVYTLIFMFSDKGKQLYSNSPSPRQW
jgi:hypothetical protein